MADDDEGQVRFRCRNCGRDLQPCPFCGQTGRQIIPTVNERVNVRENRIAVLSRLERNYRYLLGSLGVTILAPIVTPLFGLNEPIPTIIGVIAGLVAFLLGVYGIRLVKEIRGS